MKKLLPILVLSHATCAFCATPDWTPLRHSDGVDYFVASAATRQPASATPTVSVLADFKAPQTASFDTRLVYRSTVTRYRVDCASHTIAALGIRYYGRSNASGRLARRYTFEQPTAKTIISWSRFSAMQTLVCPHTDPPDQVTLDDEKPTVVQDIRHSMFAVKKMKPGSPDQ